jgi:sugar phosphate isomerase/epimerase
MQGRLIPEDLARLQVFPKSNWRGEFSKAYKIGFGHIELLYDKEKLLSQLLKNPINHLSLGVLGNIGISTVGSRSICLDAFTNVSLLDKLTQSRFINELKSVMKTLKGTKVEVLVIPFFDKNNINSASKLEKTLEVIHLHGLDELAADSNLQLALEFTLSSDEIIKEFNRRSLKNVGICFDLGNTKAAGFSPQIDIKKLGDLIKHVHIKDRKVDGPNVMLGEGGVDFDDCFASLKIIGYMGLFVLETCYLVDPVREATINLNFIKNIIHKYEA